MKGFFNVPQPKNEPILSYTSGSVEKKQFKEELQRAKSKTIDIPMYIGYEEIRTDKKIKITSPYNHKQVLGYINEGDKEHVIQAINSSMANKNDWENLSWENRATIFLKAADLLAGPYRAKINAATMLGQSKNIYQAEIDAACELIDFLRFNVFFMQQIYQQQPISDTNIWNRLEYRPLEGFVFAITPFNFTAIGGNLCVAPALMGNTVIWKPAYTQMYSAQVFMEVLREAGLPAGVINLITVDGPVAGDVIFNHKDFAGLHFTGSTAVFKHLWKTIGQNIDIYKSYPRIVGETGGKDFIFAHSSADKEALVAAIIRGGFEFQGQKCSAASRVYIPQSIWDEVKKLLLVEMKSLKMGSPEDFTNFVNAVIDEKSFDKIANYIEQAKKDKNVEIIAGGNYNKSEGYFIEPTVIVCNDPLYKTMVEEIFGPVVSIFIYPDHNLMDTLELLDQTSEYALTGAVFSKDRYVVDLVTDKLKNSAGNFYINDKPTGAVVGQQPFGGARGSGTNDKAGSMLNLLRWISPRTIKENFVPPKNYKYPFLSES